MTQPSASNWNYKPANLLTFDAPPSGAPALAHPPPNPPVDPPFHTVGVVEPPPPLLSLRWRGQVSDAVASPLVLCFRCRVLGAVAQAASKVLHSEGCLAPAERGSD